MAIPVDSESPVTCAAVTVFMASMSSTVVNWHFKLRCALSEAHGVHSMQCHWQWQ